MMKKIIPFLFVPSISVGAQFLDRPYYGDLVNLDNRYHNHKLSRFITQDAMKQYASQYVYGDGSIIYGSDPTGNMKPGDASGFLDVFDPHPLEDKRRLITEDITKQKSDNKKRNAKDSDSGYIQADNDISHRRSSSEVDVHSWIQTDRNYEGTQSEGSGDYKDSKGHLGMRDEQVKNALSKSIGWHESTLDNMEDKISLETNSARYRPKNTSGMYKVFRESLSADIGQEVKAKVRARMIEEGLERRSSRFESAKGYMIGAGIGLVVFGGGFTGLYFLLHH